jgi:DNA-directed RNA polymerase subunit K/omega
MVQRPPQFAAFEFVVVAGLRAVQLTRGCVPRIAGAHKVVTIAQLEVAAGKVSRSPVVIRPEE